MPFGYSDQPRASTGAAITTLAGARLKGHKLSFVACNTALFHLSRACRLAGCFFRSCLLIACEEKWNYRLAKAAGVAHRFLIEKLHTGNAR